MQTIRISSTNPYGYETRRTRIVPETDIDRAVLRALIDSQWDEKRVLSTIEGVTGRIRIGGGWGQACMTDPNLDWDAEGRLSAWLVPYDESVDMQDVLDCAQPVPMQFWVESEFSGVRIGWSQPDSEYTEATTSDGWGRCDEPFISRRPEPAATAKN